MRKLVSFILMALLSALWHTASAYDCEVDGIYYRLDGDEASVTYEEMVNGSYSSPYSGEISIPSTIMSNGKTYNVTSIGFCAFRDCSGLTSVTIPNSVTNIGHYAFYYCI